MLIRKQLTERARDFNIILDDVAITELRFWSSLKYRQTEMFSFTYLLKMVPFSTFSFGREYAAAVEAKQVNFEIDSLVSQTIM